MNREKIIAEEVIDRLMSECEYKLVCVTKSKYGDKDSLAVTFKSQEQPIHKVLHELKTKADVDSFISVVRNAIEPIDK